MSDALPPSQGSKQQSSQEDAGEVVRLISDARSNTVALMLSTAAARKERGRAGKWEGLKYLPAGLPQPAPHAFH